MGEEQAKEEPIEEAKENATEEAKEEGCAMEIAMEGSEETKGEDQAAVEADALDDLSSLGVEALTEEAEKWLAGELAAVEHASMEEDQDEPADTTAEATADASAEAPRSESAEAPAATQEDGCMVQVET